MRKTKNFLGNYYSIYFFSLIWAFLSCDYTRKEDELSEKPTKKEVLSSEALDQLFEKLPEGEKEKFLCQIVNKAVQNYPGLAIQVEHYASGKLRKEMERLKQEANGEEVLRLKKTIEDLEKENSVLKKQVVSYQQKIEKIEKTKKRSFPTIGRFLEKTTSALLKKRSV